MAFDKNTQQRAELESLKEETINIFVNTDTNISDDDTVVETFMFKIQMRGIIKALDKLK